MRLNKGFDSWVGKFPWRRKWQPTPVFLSGKPHGQRSPIGYSPGARKQLDTTEPLHFYGLKKTWIKERFKEKLTKVVKIYSLLILNQTELK